MDVEPDGRISKAFEQIEQHLESIIVAEVEGDLQIFVDQKLFFSEENILLLELAIAFHN
ncbi:MAG: hypothetical protein AAF383_17500 [Cyanobacteria bacterium P01_A01_bin.83]